MIAHLAKLLVFLGVLILIASLFTTRRLILRLGQSPVRRQWYVMLALILIFILCYFLYSWAFWDRQKETLDLLVPSVFLLGACFVWLTSHLSLQTVVTLLRISLLEKENISDPLTGVFNRRYLDRRLHEEVTRAARHGLPLSVLLLDIDHFKRINDHHGHQAGDQALRHFAEQIQRQLREQDILARYGGEEFMVIAPHTAHQAAINLAERLRAGIEAQPFRWDGTDEGPIQLALTCSIGVACLGPELVDDVMLIRRADENLYRAKSAGRNRVNADESNMTPAAGAATAVREAGPRLGCGDG